MSFTPRRRLSSLEGRKFIIGREGHVFISDPTASKEHAEMQIIDGRVRIRDLDSMNGIFFMDGGEAVRFRDETFDPEQVITIGQESHKIQKLIAIVSSFA